MNLNDILLKLYFDINKPNEYAGFLLRLFAFLIDFSILGILNYFLILTFSLNTTIHSDAFNPILLITHPYSIIVNWLYFAILESNQYYQATIGKKILRLKVVDLNDNRISFGKASIRYFAKIISSLILGIGFFMIVFTNKHQGFHDMAAGAFVKIKYE